jgi:hypothetical protein
MMAIWFASIVGVLCVFLAAYEPSFTLLWGRHTAPSATRHHRHLRRSVHGGHARAGEAAP